MAEPGCTARISTLGMLELQSALAGKVRAGQLPEAAAEAHVSRALLDISTGDLRVSAVTARHYLDAGRLVARFGFAHRLRSLDALQLAVALDLQSQGLVDFVVVADKTAEQVGRLAGLRIINPQSIAEIGG